MSQGTLETPRQGTPPGKGSRVRSASPSPWEIAGALVSVALALVLVCLFVNPLRETAMEDDWAYALMVKHLLQTGHYKLHDWAAANMPFQIAWGALFSEALGYSHATLRLSTLAVFFLGLAAFYFLARDHDLSPGMAGLVTLGLLGSPLVLRFAFNFMTDVPFVMWLVISVWLYGRAIRNHSYRLMVVASLAAAVATLTRQFGVALVGALGLLWLLDGNRQRQLLFYLSGAALPLIAGAWQVAAGKLFPNWTADFRMLELKVYLSDTRILLANLFWRPTVILQYLALFTLPLALLTFPTLILAIPNAQRWLKLASRKSLVVNGSILVVLLVVIAAGLLYGRHVNPERRLLPLISWNFEFLTELSLKERKVLTLLTSAGAVLLGGILVRRYFADGGWKALTPEQRLLDLVTLGLLGLHLIYAQFGDEYLIVFLPFALIILGRQLQPWQAILLVPGTIGCLVLLAGSAWWTRSLLVENELPWREAEKVRALGVDPTKIYGPWAWNCYQGAFDDYLTDIHRRIEYRPLDDGYDGLKDFFVRYLEGDRKAQAEYLITSGPPGQLPESGAERLAEIPYDDFWFRPTRVFVDRRTSP